MVSFWFAMEFSTLKEHERIGICQDIPQSFPVSLQVMWIKNAMFTIPQENHHFYRWYVYHSQSWVVYSHYRPCTF